jgi:hypothetical protein
MTPPKFSKPKPAAPKKHKRRNHTINRVIGTKEGKQELGTHKQSGWEPVESVREVWDESAEDKARHKLWCIANNQKA